MPDGADLYSALFALWSIQNSILQSFRAVFIARETFLLSFAAFMAEENSVGLGGTLLSVLGILLAIAWILICWGRGLDDSYCRLQVLKLEGRNLDHGDGRKVLTRFRQFQNQCIFQKARTLRSGVPHNMVGASKARFFLDLALPLIYLSLFCAVLCALV